MFTKVQKKKRRWCGISAINNIDLMFWNIRWFEFQFKARFRIPVWNHLLCGGVKLFTLPKYGWWISGFQSSISRSPPWYYQAWMVVRPRAWLPAVIPRPSQEWIELMNASNFSMKFWIEKPSRWTCMCAWVFNRAFPINHLLYYMLWIGVSSELFKPAYSIDALILLDLSLKNCLRMAHGIGIWFDLEKWIFHCPVVFWIRACF